jgi:hypothetical protein
LDFNPRTPNFWKSFSVDKSEMFTHICCFLLQMGTSFCQNQRLCTLTVLCMHFTYLPRGEFVVVALVLDVTKLQDFGRCVYGCLPYSVWLWKYTPWVC